MKTLILIVISCLFIDGEKDKEDQGNWVNPKIKFVLNKGETPIRQFPYNPSLKDNERRDTLGMMDFFDRMNTLFSNSGYSIKQSDKIYKFLADSQYVVDASIGMPSPDMPSPAKLTPEKLKVRLAIFKIDDRQCEIFYWRRGCGRKFIYARIEFNEKTTAIIKKTSIERWSASYPC